MGDFQNNNGCIVLKCNDNKGCFWKKRIGFVAFKPIRWLKIIILFIGLIFFFGIFFVTKARKRKMFLTIKLIKNLWTSLIYDIYVPNRPSKTYSAVVILDTIKEIRTPKTPMKAKENCNPNASAM